MSRKIQQEKSSKYILLLKFEPKVGKAADPERKKAY